MPLTLYSSPMKYKSPTTGQYEIINGIEGRGITNITLNNDYTLTIFFNDNTSITTTAIRGATGNGIQSIEKTGTSGLIDTYTITYTDGETSSFTINNGAVPTFSIGTVTEGATAAATITGTPTNPILNLTLPNANVPTNVSAFTNDAGYLTAQDISGKQDTLTFDTTPTQNSTNPVTSGGIYNAIANINAMNIHICAQGEYNAETGVPTIQNPDTSTFYLVPGGEGNNLFIEWAYVNGAWERFGSADVEVPVTDVQVNGVSVLDAQGVANVPIATGSAYGVVGVSGNGLMLTNGFIQISQASSNIIKSGTSEKSPITAVRQHESTFYGLAKAAGADMKDIANTTVGVYPDAQKEAIQLMLGIDNLIASRETDYIADKAYAVDDLFMVDGKLYKVIDAIAENGAIVVQNNGETVSGANAVETRIGDIRVKDIQVNGTSIVTDGVANVPIGDSSTFGVFRTEPSFGITVNNSGKLYTNIANTNEMKAGSQAYKPIVPAIQHTSAFYGLAKAAGDTTQSASDNAVGTYTNEAKAAIRTMLGAVGTEDYATVATGGVVKVSSSYGIDISNGIIKIRTATFNECKNQTGSTGYQPITVYNQHYASFYGLATAAGDTTQSSSSNAVGTYTDSAKASIKSMLGIVDGSTGTVDISGTTPSITAVENTRYVCGEVATLSITPPASGISIVRFTSGTTATVLTLPSTVKFPEWFDATALEADTIYELCITDGIYGAVMSWAL